MNISLKKQEFKIGDFVYYMEKSAPAKGFIWGVSLGDNISHYGDEDEVLTPDFYYQIINSSGTRSRGFISEFLFKSAEELLSTIKNSMKEVDIKIIKDDATGNK